MAIVTAGDNATWSMGEVSGKAYSNMPLLA